MRITTAPGCSNIVSATLNAPEPFQLLFRPFLSPVTENLQVDYCVELSSFSDHWHIFKVKPATVYKFTTVYNFTTMTVFYCSISWCWVWNCDQKTQVVLKSVICRSAAIISQVPLWCQIYFFPVQQCVMMLPHVRTHLNGLFEFTTITDLTVFLLLLQALCESVKTISIKSY